MRILELALRGLKGRLPSRTDLWAVFNIVLFVVYDWSIRGFLFELPSFSLYFRLWDLAGILFYMLAFALGESLMVTGALVIASVILPSTWFKQGFAYKGFLLVVVSTALALFFQADYNIEVFQELVRNDYASTWPLLEGLAVAVIVFAGLLWIFHRYARFQERLLRLTEQFTVFAYIYIPLGLIGFAFVILRNI